MKYFTSRGFTLVEAMIAVTILTLSIAGPLTAASRAIVAAQISRDQLTASYLAQEGIEYVRAMRDNEYLLAYQSGGANVSTAAWSDFLNGSSAASITQCISTTCTLDPALAMGTGSGFSLKTCSSSTCTPLYLNGGIYTEQLVGMVTAFTRTIQVITVSANDVRLVSKVSWSFHNTPYTVTIINHLTPWQ